MFGHGRRIHDAAYGSLSLEFLGSTVLTQTQGVLLGGAISAWHSYFGLALPDIELGARGHPATAGWRVGLASALNDIEGIDEDVLRESLRASLGTPGADFLDPYQRKALAVAAGARNSMLVV